MRRLEVNTVGREHLMESEGLRQKNGELFAEFSSINNTVRRQFLSIQVDILSPDHNKESQIDHINICKKFRRSLQDRQVRRGADVALDHHRVIRRLKLNFKTFVKSIPKPSRDITPHAHS